jgi:hypothetical protein
LRKRRLWEEDERGGVECGMKRAGKRFIRKKVAKV